jgi:hypothetical protein
MAHVPGFAHDVFISYSHLDNQHVDEGKGWVTDFHRRLQIELDEELGAKAAIWRDPRIGSADDFTADLTKQLRSTAVLIAVVSPAYLNSRWCEWELKGFVEGERRAGDLWVESKARAIKVIKRPGDQDAHREIVLRETKGVELFTTDEGQQRSFELSPDAPVFQRRLEELAQDICKILKLLRRQRTVFLGSASPAMAADRDKVNREMTAQQLRVLSAPADGGDDADALQRVMQECALSIHFVDRDATAAAPADLERDMAGRLELRQVVKVRDGGPGNPQNWDATEQRGDVEMLVNLPTHELNKTVLRKLKNPVERSGGRELTRVYLICERQDNPLLTNNRARSLRDHLRSLGLEVKLPLAEGGDVAEFSRDNRNKLRTCDAVLLYWGGSRQGWFEERLVELTQAIGWRRGKSFVASAAYVSDPHNPVKENYETQEVDELIKQFATLDIADERLIRFLTKLEPPNGG